jgi:hypothetical protein
LNASTRPLARRLDGWRISDFACAILLLAVYPSSRLTAQGVLEQFSYDNLKPSALQLDLGPLGGSNIRGALVGGLRLDYGLIAPHVRVLLGLSYYKADFSSEARARFEQRLRSVVIDPTGDDTINLGRITWSDVTGDVDLQYVLPQSHTVTAYLGLGIGAHLRHGSGAAINGTFVQDALNEITAGLNGTIGTEIGAGRWRVTLEGRGVLSSGVSTASLRTGVAYRWGARKRGSGR